MTPETKKLIVERCTSWIEAWGLSLAFAVTQSLERSERLVADAIVALIATELEQEAEFGPELREARRKGPFVPTSVNPVRFAATIWELADKEAYRGFGADAFFRMPAVARAIVVLKAKARFSRVQIAHAVGVRPNQVDDHLENARLLFSDGRPWLGAGPGVRITEESWVPECPQWDSEASVSVLGATAEPQNNSQTLQETFARYIGNDLATEDGHKLHSHLVVCTSCRTSFAHFKRQYLDWASSVPAIEPDKDLRKHLKKVSSMAFKVRRNGPPRALPGMRRLIRDGQVLAVLFGAASLLILHLILRR